MTQASYDEMEYMLLRKYLKLSGGGLGTEARIARAMAEELTPRQKEMTEMYYLRQMTMQAIARELGVNVSTVSRTLKRSRERLRRCLRYGGAALLKCLGE